MEALPPGVLAALVGLLGGLILGLAARLGDFTTLYALETAIYGDDQRRLRLWGIVLGTAIIAAFTAELLGYADLIGSSYLSAQWHPAASILGGILFGYGMALAGNCGFGALVRLGSGDLRALIVVVVTGIASLATLTGPLAALHASLSPPGQAVAPQGIAHLISRQTGFSPFAVALIVGASLIAWAMGHAPMRRAFHHIGWAVAAGLAVAFCLVGTSTIRASSVGAVPVDAPNFTLPLGEAIQWVMNSALSGITFPVGLVAGVMLGAMIGALLRRTFHRRSVDGAQRKLGHQIAGAALMGVGGTISMGCTIGQGLSAFSMLAYSAPVTLLAIIIGAVAGLRRLMGRIAGD